MRRCNAACLVSFPSGDRLNCLPAHVYGVTFSSFGHFCKQVECTRRSWLQPWVSLSLVPAVTTEKLGEQGASAARLLEDVAAHVASLPLLRFASSGVLAGVRSRKRVFATAAAEPVTAAPKRQKRRDEPSLDALPDECLFEVLRRVQGARALRVGLRLPPLARALRRHPRLRGRADPGHARRVGPQPGVPQRG